MGFNEMAGEAAKPLRETLKECRIGLVLLAIFSFFINLLILTSPIYMMQVYDRVLTSGRTETLVLLTIIAGIAVLVLGMLEMVRNKVLGRIGQWLDRRLSPELIGASLRAAIYWRPAKCTAAPRSCANAGGSRRAGVQYHFRRAVDADLSRRDLADAPGLGHDRHRFAPSCCLRSRSSTNSSPARRSSTRVVCRSPTSSALIRPSATLTPFTRWGCSQLFDRLEQSQ